jgi:glycerol-3-phosphate dehydrogenase (NAD(P)+)
VKIWARDKQLVESINTNHINSKYLNKIILSNNLTAVHELSKELLETVNVLIFSIPTQHSRGVLESIKANLKNTHLLIFVNKGIEMSTGLLPHEVAIDVLGKARGDECVFLSGPSFAAEVLARQPTAVSVASKSSTHCHRTQVN